MKTNLYRKALWIVSVAIGVALLGCAGAGSGGGGVGSPNGGDENPGDPGPGEGDATDWLVVAFYSQETGHEVGADAFVLVFDRDAADLSGFASFPEFWRALFGDVELDPDLEAELIAGLVSDATVTVNGDALPYFSASSLYYGELSTNTPGETIKLNVTDSDGGVVLEQSVELPGNVEVSGTSYSEAVTVSSEVIDPNDFGYEFPVYELTVDWSVGDPLPAYTLINYCAGYEFEYLFDSGSGSVGSSSCNFESALPASAVTETIDVDAFLPAFEKVATEDGLEVTFISDGEIGLLQHGDSYDNVTRLEGRTDELFVYAVNGLEIGGTTPATGSYFEVRNGYWWTSWD